VSSKTIGGVKNNDTEEDQEEEDRCRCPSDKERAVCCFILCSTPLLPPPLPLSPFFRIKKIGTCGIIVFVVAVTVAVAVVVVDDVVVIRRCTASSSLE